MNYTKDILKRGSFIIWQDNFKKQTLYEIILSVGPGRIRYYSSEAKRVAAVSTGIYIRWLNTKYDMTGLTVSL